MAENVSSGAEIRIGLELTPGQLTAIGQMLDPPLHFRDQDNGGDRSSALVTADAILVGVRTHTGIARVRPGDVDGLDNAMHAARTKPGIDGMLDISTAPGVPASALLPVIAAARRAGFAQVQLTTADALDLEP
jgi:hypothetical protein